MKTPSSSPSSVSPSQVPPRLLQKSHLFRIFFQGLGTSPSYDPKKVQCPTEKKNALCGCLIFFNGWDSFLFYPQTKHLKTISPQHVNNYQPWLSHQITIQSPEKNHQCFNSQSLGDSAIGFGVEGRWTAAWSAPVATWAAVLSGAVSPTHCRSTNKKIVLWPAIMKSSWIPGKICRKSWLLGSKYCSDSDGSVLKNQKPILGYVQWMDSLANHIKKYHDVVMMLSLAVDLKAVSHTGIPWNTDWFMLL